MARTELERVENGPGPDPPDGALLTLTVTCDGNAVDVLARTQAVLRVLLTDVGVASRTDDDWRRALPAWFVEACAPEMSQRQAEERLARWRTLSTEERGRDESDESWSLGNWLYWWRPEHRVWFWWTATIDSPDRLRVVVEVRDWPTPTGALQRLLRAAGAVDVSADSE